MRFTRRWLVAVTVAAGAWLFFSPWLLGYTAVAVATWMSYLLGAAIFVAALWAMVAREARNPALITAILGALVFASPWMLGFMAESTARVDAWFVGAVVLVAALRAATMEYAGQRPERRHPAA
jgi:hypothetical protein